MERSRRVVAALQAHPPEHSQAATASESAKTIEKPVASEIPPPPELAPRPNPLRKRASILGLEAGKPEEAPPESRPPSPDPQ